ncbi:unnamed protein product [Adineta ricciae]|uniref:HAT C-terminal dimerisation domain-containing protein n=1 Tax=Adineta ricciae TaxID=249248 RepID=A0A816AX22_ADIRI|nr:unnamed protein product [Adineta ricciae]
MAEADLSSVMPIDTSPANTLKDQAFTTTSLEHLLKRKDSRKEFIIVENNQKKAKSAAWSMFGFPARLIEDGTYSRIIGFTSCFQCKSTYTFQSDGSGSTKHLLRHNCPKVSSASETYQEEPIEKLMKSKSTSSVTLAKEDFTKMRDELTKWICSSMRPFNITHDPGLRNVLQTVIEIGKKYSGKIDGVDLLAAPTTISANIHRLAEEYRILLRSVLIEQASAGCLCICPDLWSDKHRKINYLGLIAVFVNKNHELFSVDLCCCEYNEADKTGDSVLKAIRCQLDLYGLLPFMDKKKIVFTCDRGPNILKALKGQPVILCFAHRINNVLKKGFYQQERKRAIRAATPSSKDKRSKMDIQSSSKSSSSEDETIAPSPSKYVAANTSVVELSPKARELLDIITTCKQLVKYVKLTGLNKPIQDAGGVALKQVTVVRWLSMSNLLESIESPIDYLRSILAKSTNSRQSIKLNKINVDGLKDLICLLSVFRDVSLLVQTGNRPSLHMAYIAMNKLEHHLNGTDVDKEGESITLNDRHEGTEFFRKRLFQLLKSMFSFDEKHLAAAVLHPLYRKLTFASAQWKTMAHSFIRQQIDDILGVDYHDQTFLSEPAKKKHKSMEDQFADPDDVNIDSENDIISVSASKNDELDKYLRMSIDDIYKQPNPLSFWKDNESKFPCLSLIARRLFSIPVTSAAVERSFSAAGLVVTKRRSSLDPRTLNDILFVRSIQNILEQRPNFFS